MKEIPLSQGKIALVDDADFEALSKYSWHLNAGYAARKERVGLRWVRVYMHRQILGAGPGIEIDHRDWNKLNNSRANIRLATHRDNSLNRGPHRDNPSGYKGVSFDKRAGKWRAMLHSKWLGYFETPEAAALAYNRAAKVAHGDFAWQNQVQEVGTQ